MEREEKIYRQDTKTPRKEMVEKSGSKGAKEQRSKEERSNVLAIVLAAGLSRRMGEAKLLLDWDGQTVLATTLGNVLAADFDDALLVSGGYAERVQEVADDAGVTWVHNAAFATGEMLSSLQAGLRVVNDSVDAVAVILGDMPLISAEMFNKLLTAFWESDDTIVAPVFDGKRGHPVIFGRKHFAELQALNSTNDDTPRAVIKRNRYALYLVEVDAEAVVIDLDTRESYERWRPK